MRELRVEERVLEPAGTQLSKVAYIYNGLEDMELKYAGRIFPIKFGEETKIDTFQWREVDEMSASRILYSLEGEAVARELVEKHDWDQAGIEVFIKKQTQFDQDGKAFEVGLDAAQIEELKKRCNEKGRLYKLAKIDDFRKERELGRAGQHGHRIHPSAKEIRWLKELDIEDDIFNPTDTAKDRRAEMQEIAGAAAAGAVKPIADMLAQLMKQMMDDKQAENNRLHSHPGPMGPRRRSINGKLEPLEVYEKRRAEWQAGMDAVNKAEAEASDTVEE